MSKLSLNNDEQRFGGHNNMQLLVFVLMNIITLRQASCISGRLTSTGFMNLGNLLERLFENLLGDDCIMI